MSAYKMQFVCKSGNCGEAIFMTAFTGAISNNAHLTYTNTNGSVLSKHEKKISRSEHSSHFIAP